MPRFAKTTAATALAAAFALALLATPAGAAVTFGSSLALVANNSTCNAIGEPASCTVAIGALPLAAREAAGVTAPGDGVVVGWRVRSAASPIETAIRLRVLRGNSGAGTGAAEVLPASAGIHAYPARLAVRAGDRLGVDLLEVPAGTGVKITRETTGASFDLFLPPLLDGTTRPSDAAVNDRELLLQATLEPDADRDGWGDESQDKCVGQSDPTNACAPPPAAGGATPPKPRRPDTKIAAFTLNGARASFSFRATVKGARFTCKLDKRRWKACKSPQVYRGLQAGWHRFRVKAIGPTGVADPTPAKRSFRVKL